MAKIPGGFLLFSVPEELKVVNDLFWRTSRKESAMFEWHSPVKPTSGGVAKADSLMGLEAMAGMSETITHKTL